jgi:hypothetical protein
MSKEKIILSPLELAIEKLKTVEHTLGILFINAGEEVEHPEDMMPLLRAAAEADKQIRFELGLAEE